MSMPEFLANLRAAHSLIPPEQFSIGGYENPRLRAKALDSADYWLRPELTASFSPADFQPLMDDTARLRQAVDRFNRTAGVVPEGERPTPEQRQDGLAALVEILTLLRPFFSDAGGEQLARALWRLEDHYPDYVLGFDCHFGTDSTGDPAVWVWAVVPDDTDVGSKDLDRFEAEIVQAVRTWLAAAGVKDECWPYVRLRTPQVIREAITEGAG